MNTINPVQNVSEDGCNNFGGKNGNHLLTCGSRGVMVIVVGNGHGDTSSNPGRD